MNAKHVSPVCKEAHGHGSAKDCSHGGCQGITQDRRPEKSPAQGERHDHAEEERLPDRERSFRLPPIGIQCRHGCEQQGQGQRRHDRERNLGRPNDPPIGGQDVEEPKRAHLALAGESRRACRKSVKACTCQRRKTERPMNLILSREVE